MITVVAEVWIPLAAELTPANHDDGNEAAKLMVMHKCKLPPDIRYVLGDQHFNTLLLRTICNLKGWWLAATRHRKYPHTDGGMQVRRIFQSCARFLSKNFNEHFKGIFDGHAQVPTKGLVATRRFALGAVFVYQLALLYRHEQGLDLNVGLNVGLKAPNDL